jgi:cytochrome c oxidase assembly factor CtaG
MQSVHQAVLRSWSVPPAASFAIALSVVIYLRGWWLLRRAGSPTIAPWRAAMFLLGLFSLWVALASPLDVFNGFVLTAHMLQHMVLMMVAPPLLLLGAPLVPMVRGLPVFAAREFAGPFLNWSVAKRVGTALTNPAFALLLMGVAMFAWHTPFLYELALRSPAWHQTEHASFLVASLIFWWPVVQPWPSRSQWPRWAIVPYLLVADLQNTALSAILAFSDRVLYPSYSSVPRLFGFSALEDQIAAGSIMWVVGSIAFVIPAVVIAVRCLSTRPSHDANISVRRQDSSAAEPRLPATSGLVSRARWGGERLEAASFLILFTTVALCFAGLVATGTNDGDDQVLRFKGTSGSFAVAVYAPPGDLAADETAVDVLVQDRNTQDVLLDATIDVTALTGSGAQGTRSSVRASNADSQNKLLQSAKVRFGEQGDWKLNIAVTRNHDSGGISLPLRVVTPETGGEYPVSYVVMAALSVILLGAYLWRHQLRRPEAPARGRTGLNPVKERSSVLDCFSAKSSPGEPYRKVQDGSPEQQTRSP